MKLNKTEQKLVDQLHVGQSTEAIVNPFSGVRVVCVPLAVALYDYIQGCQLTGSYKYFDTARYLFQKQWPAEYMQLLD